MARSLLQGKTILAVDDEPDVLDILAEELEDCGAEFERSATYEDAIEKISSFTYDLVVLDIMGVRGFELLEYATAKKTPVVMLTAHALSPQSLKKSIELGARAYLPKDQLGQIAPFLEDVLTLSYQSAWKSLFERLGGYFGKRFGPEWRKSEKEFWEKFEKDLEVHESTIIQS
ncbi:MAG: response regulator [Desulfomonile tiedjei]|nr:response regulator [Desulfomonile tiedjei]